MSKSIIVDGIEYIAKSEVKNNQPAPTLKGLRYVICRTDSAGVFAGYLKSRKGQEAELLKARRLWYWDGAASLSQLATDGTSKPKMCKFPCEVESVELTQVIEILPVTKKAQDSIASVSVWQE